MENEDEMLDSQNEQTDSEQSESVSDTQNEEVDVEALKQQNRELFARAKRAEGFTQGADGKWVKQNKPAPKVEEVKSEAPGKAKFSISDLEEAAELLEVPKGARQEVADYAERKGISYSEAKKAPFIKSFIQNYTEELKTAQATQTKNSGRSSSKTNDEKILEDFANGIMPEDPAELSMAQYRERLKKRKN